MNDISRRVGMALTVALLAVDLHAASLKVAALNLEWFPGQWPQPPTEEMTAHQQAARPVIEALSPDIFIATEICDETALREVLAGVPGLTLHIISNFREADDDPERRNQQIAIASRLKAFAGWAEPWEQTTEGLRRGFAFAALENPETGRLILVYGLHLKSNSAMTPEQTQLNYAIRDASTRQLIAHAKKMAEQFAERGIDGWIIAGDINTNHDGRFEDNVVAMLEAEGYWNTWRPVPPEQRYTWKGRIDRFQPTTFDYIFLRGLGQPTADLLEIHETISDHNAVIVHINLPGKAEEEEKEEAPPSEDTTKVGE